MLKVDKITSHLRSFVLLLIALGIISCQRNSSTTQVSDSKDFQLFNQLDSERSNVNFENTLVENNRINILNYLYYYNGSGVAVGDINNDGLPDIYFASTVGKNKLFLNKGDLRFEDISTQAGVSGDFGITTGVSFVDVNNDGNLDIYVCKSGDHSKRYRTNQLFINNGKLGFTEQASDYNLDDHSYSSQAYFFDMDMDGDLDMYLVNHPIDWVNMNKIMTGDQEMLGFDYQYSDKLYQNDGEGKFIDITKEAGILNRSWGLSASVGDFNADGLLDIYVANDFIKPDNLYINNGDGTFSDRIKEHFRHISFFSMGTDYADINNDGLNDLYVLDMAMKSHERSKRNMGSMSSEDFRTIVRRGYHYPYSTNTLHLNLGNSQPYTEIAQMAGVDKTDWSWSPLMVDLDNDGLKDIFITNGIYRDIIDNDFKAKKKNYDTTKHKKYFDDLIAQIPQTKIKNFVFRNNGDLSFKDLSDEWGISIATNSNGSAFADLDLDGDLDLITNNLNEPSQILENRTSQLTANNYLKVKLIGNKSNPFAIGASVEIVYDEKIQRQDVIPTRGYLSSSDYTLHFGLGNVQSIGALNVKWPDGKQTVIDDIEINKTLEIKYGAEFVRLAKTSSPAPIFKEISRNLDLLHKDTEVAFDDFEKEILLPHKLSENGPFVAVGDVDNDGLEDFYIGGSAGEEASLYVQNRESKFSKRSQSSWNKDKRFEDQGALFFDADNDADLDLYVISGSNQFNRDELLQDRLYLNDGTGNFIRSIEALPKISSSGSKVICSDIDGDDDLDIVVGGRVVPKKYPTSPESYLLENVDGKFIDVTQKVAPDLQTIGMITDMEFSDFDNDGDLDIAIVGEWMTITFLEYENEKYAKTSIDTGLAESSGWWFSISSGDLDNDGDTDYVVGNIGANNKYHPSVENPLHIYYDDFDGNNTGDIILSKQIKGNNYPIRGRECSSQQVPDVAKKFPTYASFAKASLEDIYSLPSLEASLHLEAKEFRSCALINDGNGRFDIVHLPALAQFSPLLSIELLDLNGDEILDVIAAGNFYASETETIRYDGGTGVYLIGDGSGSFTSVQNSKSGLNLSGNVKDLAKINLTDGAVGILVSRNNEYLQLWTKTEEAL
ncbi:MAG: VCBS repeat-containing protein [Cyclobacteriaceae bacterium]